MVPFLGYDLLYWFQGQSTDQAEREKVEQVDRPDGTSVQ